MYITHMHIYIYIFINIGLGHLDWEILPGPISSSDFDKGPCGGAGWGQNIFYVFCPQSFLYFAHNLVSPCDSILLLLGGFFVAFCYVCDTFCA